MYGRNAHHISQPTNEEDSQGKLKDPVATARQKIAWTAFSVSLCLAFVFSQWAYLLAYRQRVLDRPSLSSNDGAILVSQSQPRSHLEELLRLVDPDGASLSRPPEVLIALCTMNLVREGMLPLFMEGVLRSGITNYLVIALDAELFEYMSAKGWNVYHHKVGNMASYNHAVSAKKFKVIASILSLGWNVLLSDIDVIFLRNPFQYLYRDHDVEAMTDGFDDPSSFGQVYGHDDPSMGWARHAQGLQHLNLNSGLFYIKASKRALDLMERTANILEEAPGNWDQAVMNDQLFVLSHGDYLNPGCSVRVMEREKFMNSKVLFKEFRHRDAAQMLGDSLPILIHMNYHPDKMQRLQAAVDFFINGNMTALAEFPGGSEPGT